MAIMAMATVRKIKHFRNAKVMALLTCFIAPNFAYSGEWEFVPSFNLEETYTDNVELTPSDSTSSLVSQAIVGLNANYASRLADFSFTGQNSNIFFSHDNELRDNFLTLNTEGRYKLWSSGPELFANAKVGNISKNSATNGLADLVSGDTVQSENYSAGVQYNVNNSDFSIASSVSYSINQSEDDLGEYNGATATLNGRSGNNARRIFWQIDSNFMTKSQDFSGDTRKGDQYRVDAQLGFITPYLFTPFIRFYDEDFSGDFINQSQQTTSSWGPGVRWLVSPRLIVNLSYNYVADKNASDDYAAGSVQWQPSARTSLSASYSQRFFGDSYSLDLNHRTKRLTNSITYNENIEVFDRNNFEQIDLGLFWCPNDAELSDINQCFSQAERPSDGEYLLGSFFKLEPVESNEFSLNKTLAWATTLQLARTSFTFNSSATRREALETKIIDDTLSASISIDRKISGKSNLTFLAKFDYRLFDKENANSRQQEDYYRTISTTYTKSLASSLSGHFTIQHVNRSSTSAQYDYEEIRAIINVTKEF